VSAYHLVRGKDHGWVVTYGKGLDIRTGYAADQAGFSTLSEAVDWIKERESDPQDQDKFD
jgi:hypothetical protein